MRGKIIAIFSVIVLIVGGLSYALMRATLGDLSTPGDAPRALAGAVAELQLEGLVLERWLAAHAHDPKLREPFDAGTPNARAEAATTVANGLRDAAASAPELSGLPISLVVLVDAKGVVLGRNGSALMRGDDLGSLYPHLKQSLATGASGSDVWVNHQRNEQLLASYAPIRGADGAVIGGIAIGTSLNNERLSNASDRTSGRTLIAAVKSGDGLDIIAKSGGATPDIMTALAAAPAKDAALKALASGQVADLGGLPKDTSASSRALDGYGDGHRAVLIAVSQVESPAAGGGLLWPVLGATVLGLILVALGGYLLDAYISRPISEIEDGLLAIMNGRADLRFEIEHAELGGLVFRLNSLLNQLLGVQEDDTDAEGRPSHAPTARSFQDALAVDESMAQASAGESADARALRDEPDGAYYARIFREYIDAKRRIGDPTEHITEAAFVARIQASEREMAEKHGKPVRYKIEVRGREVALLAVPLA